MNQGFQTLFHEAIANVKPIPEGTDPGVIHDWTDATIDALCGFFTDWYEWMPEVETGLRYIQRFRTPGLANWLDTGGWPEGTMTYRWALATTFPHPSTKKVRVEELTSLVPENAVRATPEERADEMHSRRQHLAYRFNRG